MPTLVELVLPRRPFRSTARSGDESATLVGEHIKQIAKQLPSANRWGELLRHICQRNLRYLRNLQMEQSYPQITQIPAVP
ncbi:hypothetical protein [Verminephrobacter eiseniae]|uniref:hypothetical protein n=1 Tax=Verminephrobacter eiseniae TaxID=364317 RepID=UPI002237274E|nr:hypothetical protein [Verminephrobacter eiseniae]